MAGRVGTTNVGNKRRRSSESLVTFSGKMAIKESVALQQAIQHRIQRPDTVISTCAGDSARLATAFLVLLFSLTGPRTHVSGPVVSSLKCREDLNMRSSRGKRRGSQTLRYVNGRVCHKGRATICE